MSCNCLDKYSDILDNKDQIEEQDLLISISQLAPYLGVKQEDIEDDIIEPIALRTIEAVSAQVEMFLNRKLKHKENIVESVQGFGAVDIILKRPPIQKIKCIHQDGLFFTGLEDIAIMNSGQSGVVRFSGKTANTAALANIYPLSEHKNYTNFPSITVIYDGGYVIDDDEDEELDTEEGDPITEESESSEEWCPPFPIEIKNKVGLPAPIIHALCLEISRLYKAAIGEDGSKFRDPELRRERLGDYDISFFDPISVDKILDGEKTYGLSRDVIELIRPYRLGVF